LAAAGECGTDAGTDAGTGGVSIDGGDALSNLSVTSDTLLVQADTMLARVQVSINIGKIGLGMTTLAA
jgi:hypothetical protein